MAMIYKFSFRLGKIGTRFFRAGSSQEVLKKSSNDKCTGPRSRIGANQKALKLHDKVTSLSNVQEDIYSKLDKWSAFERSFPIVTIKQTLMVLKREEKWDRISQVIKWMLSKGQGKTMRTYELLLEALDKLGRADEAKLLWENTISKNMGCVPGRMVSLMISIYDHHDMPEQIIKLFTCVEGLERKPHKDTVVKAAKAFGRLGFLEREKQLLRKYDIVTVEKHESGEKG